MSAGWTRHAAAATLQLFWYKCQANEEAAERLQEKKRLLEEERRRKEELRRRQANMATRIQVRTRRRLTAHSPVTGLTRLL